MKTHVRLWPYLVAGGGLLVVVCWLNWDGISRLSLDWQEMTDALSERAAIERRSQEWEEKLAGAHRTWAGKKKVLAEVIAQRMTLLEAAARFRGLDEENLGFDQATFRRMVPGGSDGERYCRVVIRHVEEWLRDQPCDAAKLVPPLERELEELLQRDGTVHLPEVRP